MGSVIHIIYQYFCMSHFSENKYSSLQESWNAWTVLGWYELKYILPTNFYCRPQKPRFTNMLSSLEVKYADSSISPLCVHFVHILYKKKD
jgi:predicted membrane-bound dolichyl-phosphate-mannose-protein mannosyltransferase